MGTWVFFGLPERTRKRKEGNIKGTKAVPAPKSKRGVDAKDSKVSPGKLKPKARSRN